MRVAFYRPSQNLGCLGFRLGSLYIDFFRTPYWGTFISVGGTAFHQSRIWIHWSFPPTIRRHK